MLPCLFQIFNHFLFLILQLLECINLLLQIVGTLFALLDLKLILTRHSFKLNQQAGVFILVAHSSYPVSDVLSHLVIKSIEFQFTLKLHFLRVKHLVVDLLRSVPRHQLALLDGLVSLLLLHTQPHSS